MIEQDPNVKALLSAAAKKLQLLAEDLPTAADNDKDSSGGDVGGAEVDCVSTMVTFNSKRCYLKAKQPCCSSKMSHKGEIESGGGGGPHRQGYTWSSRTQMLRWLRHKAVSGIVAT